MADESMVSDRIMEGIRRSIYAGELKPGDPLRQDHIATRFRTSKPPVREALRRLQAQDYVDFAPNRGFFVKVFKRSEILNLFEMCALFEGHAVLTGAARLTRADLLTLDGCVNRIADSKVLLDRLKADTSFHMGLAAGIRNERIRARIEEFHAYFRMYYLALDAARLPRPTETYHRVLTDLRQGNIMAAAARIQVYLLDEGRRLSVVGDESGSVSVL